LLKENVKGNNGEKTPYIQFEWKRPGFTNGDCIVGYQLIKLYSDGNYSVKYVLRDTGTIFGDTFTCKVYIKDKNNSVLLSFFWKKSLAAGDYSQNEFKGFGNLIKKHYSKCAKASARLHCTGGVIST